MLNIYPVTAVGPQASDYKVKINGRPVSLDTARVSAMCFNRRWPGHQRQLEQTELANFILLSADKPLTFEIASDSLELAHAIVRPLSLGIVPQIRGNTAIFTIPCPSYFTFEPNGRSHALHVFIDSPEKNRPAQDDACVLYYGPGVHEAGVITLKDNQTLYLDEGAVVFACIRAFDASNIRILGRGILDNSHNLERILFEANETDNQVAVCNAERDHTVQLEYCTNVIIDGITIRDSLVYNIRPIGCRNVSISNVKIIGCWRYNSDGIDMHNCENVLIDRCFLRTFDDSICVKGFDCYYEGDVEAQVQQAMHYNGGCHEDFRHVLVRNCVIWNDWGKCLEIGAETRAGEICDIRFEACDIIHVTASPLDCCNVDYAHVHDVSYRGINIEFDDIIPTMRLQHSDNEPYRPGPPDNQPAVISVGVIYHPEYSAGGKRRGKNSGFVFEDIRLRSNKRPLFSFAGYDETHLTDGVVIRNFLLNGRPLASEADYELVTNEFCDDIQVFTGMPCSLNSKLSRDAQNASLNTSSISS